MKFLNLTTRLLVSASLIFSFALAAVAPATSFAQDSSATQHDKKKANDKHKKPAKKSTKKIKTSTKLVTETKLVPFATQQTNNPNMPKGQTSVVRAGHNGTETRTYKVTLKNGKQTKKVLIMQKTTVAAVAQIVAVGTYVAQAPTPAADPTPTPAPTQASPANTYTNVDGNTIESPSSNTSGATGVCRDGTYTHAVNHQGACSSHGGVDHWL